LQDHKYEEAWQKLTAKSEEARAYLLRTDVELWTLYADGCYRWGISKTNISGSYNNVLRGTRRLPVRALVEATLEKTIRLFVKNYESIKNCETVLAPEPNKTFMKYRLRAQWHHVNCCNPWTAEYEVRTRDDRNVQHVRYAAMSCSCGKWQTFRLDIGTLFLYEQNLFTFGCM